MNYEEKYNELVGNINLVYKTGEKVLAELKEGKHQDLTALTVYKDTQFAMRYKFGEVLMKEV